MNVEKKPKKRLDTETKSCIMCVMIIVVMWVLKFVNDKILENKYIECALMMCIWTVAIFGNRIVKHFTSKRKD